MPLPPELVISIENASGDEYLVKTTRPNGEEICRHTFHFSPDLLVDLEPQWMLDKAVPRDAGEAIKRSPGDSATAPDEKKLAQYGQRLHGFLFGDGARWNNFLEFNDAYHWQARVTLALHKNAAALWRLPWEYIHDGQDFLALHGRFLLARMPYGLRQLDPAPVALPVRLLVVVAAPDDQKPLDTEKEIGVIQAALDEAVRQGSVQVEYLDDATLPAIGDALRHFRPHVLHYTGHGKYDEQAARSFLALEDEDGRTEQAGIQELRPFLKAAPDLRLVVLSGCQTAQTSDVDAFRGVATGMLEADIPAVLAMQYSILDQSGIKLAEALYAALAEGETPDQAMCRVRLALWQFDQGPGYDWGVPALYLRAQGMRLVDPTVETLHATSLQRVAAIDVGGLPLPPHFVGRKAELRQLRRALRDANVTAAFVRGIGGVGKSSVAAKLMQRPGVELDGALVIRCNEVAPQDIPAKLAHFLTAQGKAGHAEAAGLLLDSRYPPAERARRALESLADRRYLIVLDNFESVMETPSPSPVAGATGEGSNTLSCETGEGRGGGDISDPDLRAFVSGLLDARWRGLCLLTGRYRLRALTDVVGRGAAIELQLNDLTAPQAIMLMNNLPRLRREPLATKIELYNKVGGHPKSIELLEGWLATGQVRDLLSDPALDNLLREQWEDYFLRALLARLSEAERVTLARLCIFRMRLGEEAFAYAHAGDDMVRRWLDLSLLQREDVGQIGNLSYSIHPVVREYLLGQTAPDALRELHTWAAAYQGQPFVEIARQAVAQSGQRATEAQIQSLARDRNGVVGQMVARTDDLGQARGAMARALEWHYHLFAAGAYDAAKDIQGAVWAVLARWGERDRAKALLRSSIKTLEGGNKAKAQGNLATLLKDEGKLEEALAINEELCRTFEAMGAKRDMAVALNRQSILYDMMGRRDDAVTVGEKSLEISRERNDEENQAIGLHQLSIFYMEKSDYTTAMTRSEEAEKLFRKLNIEAHVAATLFQQGLIHNELARAAKSDMERQNHRRAAFELFQQNLEIMRRVGYEAGVGKTLGEFGKMLSDAGQLREAIEAFTEALEIAKRLGNPVSMAICLSSLGLVHERQEQYAAALEKYEQALELFKKYASPQYVADTENNIARVRGKLGG